MAAIGWYGPLIDLSKAGSHVGEYVQLLVFVHKSRPIQKFKSPKEGALLRTDIQVGDDTRSFFSVSLWQKQMGSMVFAGDVILLQNVKVVRFGETIEARTVHFSSLLCLVHPYDLLESKGVDDLLANCRVGNTTREKLRKVIEWVKRTGSTDHNVQLHNYEKRQLLKNWKVNEERKSIDCISISEVSCLGNSCKATFYAHIGELFLPFTCATDGEKERVFISKRLFMSGYNKIAEDFICTGCKLCGSPLGLAYGSLQEQSMIPLYCQKSSNRLHAICFIYRPFLLYVWDQSECIPLFVTNKVAELLFADITAEKVYLCYTTQKQNWNLDLRDDHEIGHSDLSANADSKAADSRPLDVKKTLKPKSNNQGDRKNPNFFRIWLILLKMLLQQGKNSSLKFEITVNTGLDQESGRFELVSMMMPCFRMDGPV
ncbi:PREDICTED: uncharacterized protein LOC104608507 isoform X1 [Nelumbo nucifera]|uniref:Uncharacterized protein LOC104608507 isoform X1 n=3 Tax=Nelumbo nucifera TaxID=4432 RepID=A0A1U8B920_NELNU|nr:PREDICTED: uncharacterized protein LOC104608507 isoform X1 [Nelumbo nucifera]DAD39574.1 TPA_asm: hypothetical protein HUJ06_013897 [Nelumbo nucifera]